MCPNALRIVGYAVRKLNSQPKLAKWLALRVSYGMNGILLRDEHLPQLATYLRYAQSWTRFRPIIVHTWCATGRAGACSVPQRIGMLIALVFLH